MKFDDCTTEYPISITLQLHTDSLVFLSKNSLSAEAVKNFQAFIREITAADPSELLVRQLEKNAEDDNLTSSGLGLLKLLSDYLAKVGWKFESAQETPTIMTVTTMVYLTT